MSRFEGERQSSMIALFGCGYWGKNILRNLRELDAISCVVEPTSAGAEHVREIAPELPLLESMEEALSDSRIRGVMIATPAETHFEIAREALLADRDVFVEKPLTTDLNEGRLLVELAEERRRILMVGHLLEYHPAIRKIYDLIYSGTLGDLRYIISNRLNLGKIRTEENALWSFAPHDLAVILRAVGSLPIEVVATGGSYIQRDVADVTVTQLLFNKGVRAHIFVSWLHPFKEQKFIVIGSKRMVSFDDVSKELLMWELEVEWKSGQPVPVKHPGVKLDIDWSEPLRMECLHFLDCIKNHSQALTDGKHGLAVLEILHASQQSLSNNGQCVEMSGSATYLGQSLRMRSDHVHG